MKGITKRKKYIKRITSLMLILTLICTMSIPILAVVDPAFSNNIDVKIDTGIKANGQNTLDVTWELIANKPNMTLANTQGIRLAYDNTVLQLVSWDGSKNYDSEIGTLLKAMDGASKIGTVEAQTCRVHAAKNTSGDTGLLSFELGDKTPFHTCTQGVAVPLMHTRFAFRAGKSEADLKQDTIRNMTVSELYAMSQSCGVIINANANGDVGAFSSYEYMRQQDGTLLGGDTLNEPVIILPEASTELFIFKVNSISGMAGSTVKVTISAINNPGFNAAAFIVSYNVDELLLLDYKAMQSSLPLNPIEPPDTRETGSQVISLINGTQNCEGDVDILELRFLIRKNTEGDANINLRFTAAGEPSNVAGQDIAGAVTIGGKVAVFLVPPPVFKVGNVSAPRGSSITVPISIEENPGINAVAFVLTYDPSVLEITGFTAVQPDLPLNSNSILTTTPGRQTVGLVNGLANYNGNGIILNVTFKININAKLGNTELGLAFTTVPAGYPSNVSGYDFTYALAYSGSINVLDIIYGDVNRSGTVTNADLTLMLQFFAGWDVNIDMLAADVNASGSVTNADLTLMLQYFAGWDVTFGPKQ